MTSISDTEVVNAPGGLVELAHLDLTSAVTVTSTSGQNVGGSVTAVCDGSPIIVEMFCPYSVIGNYYLVSSLYVDGSFQQRVGVQVNDLTPFYAKVRLTPSAGVHTFQWSALVNAGSGTFQFDTAPTTNGGPGFIRVSKIIQASQLLVTQSNAPTVTDLPSNPVVNQEVHHLVNNSYFDKKYNGSSWVNINEQPSVEVVAGAAQTGLVVDTWTKLTFPSATVTNNFGFTVASGVITIPSSLGGLYHVSGQCQWDSNSVGIRLLSFAESGNYNGTVLSGPTVSSAAYMRTTVSGLIRLVGGQSYCLWVINSGSGGTRDLTISFLTQRFNIVRVSS